MDERVHDLLSIWEKARPKPPLEELCRDAPELLEEIRRHLADLDAADARLGTEAMLPEGAPEAGHDARPAIPRVPGYQVLHRLGEGGMGVVWLAIQLSTKRRVALKLMSAASFASDRARARFEREVELAARLDHPGIAGVYDSGEVDGLMYYAMELVEGLRLDEYCDQNRLSQRQVGELMHRVCQAVEHAHQRGIIHRDLKPSNILVNRAGEPRVLDFGLARDLDGGPAISIDGDLPGTPAYMSPEQARGERERVDTRSDVYALGVIFQKLVTGKHPHDVSGSAMEIMRRIGEGKIRTPRTCRQDLDPEIEAILLKALSFHPQDRYGSAGALADDLGHCLRNEPLSARAPTLMYFAERHLKRHFKGVIAGAVILLLLAAAALAWVMSLDYERSQAVASRNRAQNQRGIADARAVDADHQRASAIRALAQQIISGQDDLEVYHAPLALRRSLLESAMREINTLEPIKGDKQLDVTRLKAIATIRLAEVDRAAARDMEAGARFRGALELFKLPLEGDPPGWIASRDMISALVQASRHAMQCDHLAEARQMQESALRLAERWSDQANAESHVEWRQVLTQLGDLALAETPELAIGHYGRAHELRDAGPMAEAGILHRLAAAHLRLGGEARNLATARTCADQAVTKARGVVIRPTPAGKRLLAATLGRQAEVLLQMGVPGEALPPANEALLIIERLVERAPDYAELRMEWATLTELRAAVHRDLGQAEQAAEMHRKAIERLPDSGNSPRVQNLRRRLEGAATRPATH